MINTTKFHYEYLKQINRINSNFNKSVTVVDRDGYFNHAIDIVQENFSAVIETNPTVKNHMRQLEKKNVCLKCRKVDDTTCVAKYPADFYRRTRQSAVLSRDCCDDTRKASVIISQSDDLTESLLKDPSWQPSWEWAEVLGNAGAGGLYIYHAKDFNVDSVCIDYIRKIKHVAAPSLLDCENKCYEDASGEQICSDKNFEIDSTYIWRKVVDIAVALTLRDLGQMDDFQTKLNQILFTESVYIR